MVKNILNASTEITIKRKQKRKTNKVESQEEQLLLSLDDAVIIDSPVKRYKILTPDSVTIFKENDRKKYKSIRRIDF